MTIQLDFDAALYLLNKQVEKKGADYIYQQELVTDLDGTVRGDTCKNWHDGRPSCIVGHVYADVLGGVPRDFTLRENTTYISAASCAEMLGIELTRPARDLLLNVQAAQDRKVPWGAAVEHAVSEVQCSGQEVMV